MTQLIIVYPINEELRFFRKTIKKFRSVLDSDFRSNRLSNNKISHELCISELEKISEKTLVLFFLHGHSNSLLGCSYKKNNISGHTQRYVHGPFIDGSNIAILRSKKIICVSCKSNNFAKYALDAGAQVVLGFDEINFDMKKFIENGTWHKYVVNNSKYLFRKALFWSVIYALEKDLSFYQFELKLKLSLNKLSNQIVLENRNSPRIKYYKRVANCLDEIQRGIKIYGNPQIKLFS